MNEDLHIEKAAHLADKPGAENLATDRARLFVAEAMAGQKKQEPTKVQNIFVRKPFYAWGGVAMALAACVALAVVLFRPVEEYGVPGQLHQNIAIHADTDVTDTITTESSDSLAIESIVMPEE